MLKPALLAALLAVLPLGAAWPASPQENRATGGSQLIPGGQHVLGETADQVRAGQTIGKDVWGPNRQHLGIIENLLISRHDGSVDLAVINRNDYSGNQHAVVSWRDLHLLTPDQAGYSMNMTASDLANAPSFEAQAKKRPDYFNYRSELQGQEAVSQAGQPLGTIDDIVFERGSGKVDLLLVHGGQGFGTTNLPHGISWDKLASNGKPSKDLVLDLTPQQFAGTPYFGGKAAIRPNMGSSTPPAPTGNNAPLGVHTVAPQQIPKEPQ